MTRKLTQKQVEKRLAKIGFTALSEYITAKAPLTVRCPNGHIRTIVWDCARHGDCAECAKNIPLTESDYRVRGKRCDLTWIAKSLPKNSSTPTEWQCPNGHVFFRTMNHIVTRSGQCPICTRHRRLSDYDYIELANSVGIEWIGPLPANNNASTSWKCSRGHIFDTSYKSVSHMGRFAGCMQCKLETFVGEGSPRWRGGWDESAAKHRNRLKRYNLLEKNNADSEVLTAEQWKRTKEYFEFCCVYCGEPTGKPHKDHFIPIVAGGQHTVHNVVPACPKCNQRKNSKMPLDWLTIEYGLFRAEEIYHSILEYFEQAT